MKFFLTQNCRIDFCDEIYPREHRANFTVNPSFEVERQPGDDADFMTAVTGMAEVYKSLDSKGSIILKKLNQALCQGSLQFIMRGSLLTHLSGICGKDNVRVTVTLSNFSNGSISGRAESGRMTTKGMIVLPKCEDTTVKFPNPSVFNMFYNWSGRISALMIAVLEVTSPKPVSPSIQPKPCNVVYKKMLEDEVHSDVLIISKDGKQIKCHKSVLSTCSSVFEAMFQTDMKESKTHQIEMPDMTEEGIRAFLKYIYFASTEEPEKNCKIAFELLVAAHKYNVTPDLETEMKKLFLSKSMEWYTIEVAINLFQFARSIPSGGTLKSKSILVLKKNSSTLKEQQSFQEMFQKNPEAAMELCVAFGSN